MNKNIIILSSTSWSIYNFRSGLIKSLIKDGYNVYTISKFDRYVEKLKDIGCNNININFNNSSKNPIHDFILLIKYLYIFLRINPKFILSFNIKPNIYGSICAYLLRFKIVNNIAGLGIVYTKAGLLSKLVTFLYKISLSKSYYIFFQNQNDRNLFIKYKIVKIYNTDVLPGSGVDTKKFQYNPLSEKKWKNIRFVLISRLLWSKGILEYAKASSFLKSKYPHVEFNLVGFLNSNNKDSLNELDMQKLLSTYSISYLGAADDSTYFIQTSDCVVLPSYYPEGTPKILLEASAIGRPIITTDMPGCRDVVKNNLNGYICKPKNVEDLIHKIEQIIIETDDQRNQKGKEGRNIIENYYSEDLVINKYMKVIN
jgi:glycosyltransferase involved in cell wall biosynthesis